MKKLGLIFTVILTLVFTGVFAEGIEFTHSLTWKQLLAKAKRENKIIFLDAYATWCGPCKYLQNDVFTQAEVGQYFNTAFINAKIDMEKGEGTELSEKYKVTAYPTLFFINGDGNVVHKYVGALNASDLLKLGKDAKDPSKQYYTLKTAAERGTLSPKDFHNWIHQAEKMDDDDRKDIISDYLTKTTFSILDKEILQIIFDHSATLTSSLLNRINSNRLAIMKARELTEEDFNTIFKDKVVAVALKQAVVGEDVDFTKFKIFTATYFSAQAELETQKMKVKYYFYMDKDEQGLAAFSTLFANARSLQLNGMDMSNLMIEHGKKIVENNKTAEFRQKIINYQLFPAESNKGYFKDVALGALYYYSSDTAKVKEISDRLLANTYATAEVKKFARAIVKEESAD